MDASLSTRLALATTSVFLLSSLLPDAASAQALTQRRPQPSNADPSTAAEAVRAASVVAMNAALAKGTKPGSWQPLTNQPPIPEIFNRKVKDLGPGGAGGPLLMTDGGILVQNNGVNGEDAMVYKLTPDTDGSYVNGTWSQLASKTFNGSSGAQAVLPNGKILIEGGEYSGFSYRFTLTHKGTLYDPVTDTWTAVAPPSFFVDLYPPRAVFAPNPIGDSASVILADGTFMLADKMSRQAALLDYNTMTWTETGTSTKSDLNDEEGWTLLPDGTVLTIDCYTDFGFGLVPSYPSNPTNSEIYNPVTGQWSSAGSTIHTLTDTVLSEMGPAVLRPDGTVFAVGSSGDSSIYNTKNHQWTLGPTLPISPQGYQYTVQDGPGVLLPNGNVLIAASGGAANKKTGYYSNPPVGFFEFDGTSLIPEPTIPNAANDESGSISLLLLPTGQVLSVDDTNDVEIYTPSDMSHDSAWEPVITSVPPRVSPGGSYPLEGIRLNGMSQACAFGDEVQCATNYPLVRISNLATGHVFYSRTHDHSSMAVASNSVSSTHFDVPANQEKGRSEIVVVANGIASAPITIAVE